MPILDRDAARQKLDAFRAGPDESPPSTLFGRGIVICAGGAQMLVNAYVLLDVLRNVLNCTLDVEVWHLGEGEMTPAMAALMREHGAEVIDARQVMRRHPAQIVDGWQLKAYALLRSRFAEVLLLDADQVPARDPATVFDWPGYRETGAVFWPDIVALTSEAEIWAQVGLEPQARTSFESGQLVVDKRRHWNALRLVLYLNEEAETYYRLIYGDKDTFLIAWLLCRSPAFLVPHPPFVAAYGLTQREPDGRPLFQHRTYGKWIYLGEQFVSPEFEHTDACLAALERLREKWVGRAFHPPARSIAAREAEDALAGAVLHLSAEGGTVDAIELRPHAEFGRGRSPERQHWYVVEEVDGTLALMIFDGSRETYRLVVGGEGAWSGQRLVYPQRDFIARVAVAPVDLPPRRNLVDDLLRAAGFPDCDDADFARLEAGLVLLARVDPGIPSAIEAALAREGGSGLAQDRLAALATRLAELAAPRNVRSVWSLLHTAYRPVSGP